MIDLGVGDSKKIADGKIKKLAAAIRKMGGVTHEIISIGPAKYNELYQKFGNLNRMLAWGHAKVIENLHGRRPDCGRALCDQFTRQPLIKRALVPIADEIELQERTGGESDIAVAAASVLARDKFVAWIEQASEDYGLTLPKGASAAVVAAAGELVAARGKEVLHEVAKTHFKTAAQWL